MEKPPTPLADGEVLEPANDWTPENKGWFQYGNLLVYPVFTVFACFFYFSAEMVAPVTIFGDHKKVFVVYSLSDSSCGSATRLSPTIQ